ncbi:4-hydroxy-4-methyl-2-oxoglutarate aldolase [Scenedesmus sp. PABB004]|nr:4-hydroxy-4-methyl-2-oxoglutarate aldolase [Scenedesmus sp. PABB004]
MAAPAPATADLCDQHIGDIAALSASADASVRVVPDVFRSYGGVAAFAGPAHTVKCHECNTLVRKALEGPGGGRVLVVDGGGSQRCALLGDALGELAVKNGWAGVVVDGPVRDSAALGRMALGVKARGTCPLKSDKAAIYQGAAGVPVSLAGVPVAEGEWVYADADGVLVSAARLGA